VSHTSVRSKLLALSLLALAPSALSAQARFEITPFIGSYYGLTHLTEQDNGGFLNDGPFTVDQNNALALGGRISIPLSPRFAVEGEFAYSKSGLSVKEEDAFGDGLDGGISQDAYSMYGSVRAVFTPARSNLFLIAGPAVIKKGGDAWEGIDSGDLTDFGGAVGFGIRANVTPRFRLNLTAETYLYSFQAGDADSKFQSDVLVSVGIPISLGR
jgi:hypothetical protein